MAALKSISADGTLEKAAVRDDVDIVLVSVVGINGLLPTLEATVRVKKLP